MVTEKAEIPHVKLQYLEHLNAVINETLRLRAPVGTALQRLTPPEGLNIGTTYIPGNMTVWCPQYVIGRGQCHIHSETTCAFLEYVETYTLYI